MAKGSFGANGGGWRTALSALSAYMPLYLETKRLRSQGDDLDRGYMEARRHQQDIDEELGDQIQSASQSSHEEQVRGLNDYQTALAQHRARSNTSAAPLTGERYEQGAAQAQQNVAAHGATNADYLSRIDAPVRRNQNVNQEQARGAQRIASSQQGADLAQYIAELRARRHRVDPLQLLLAQIAGSVAQNWQGSGSGRQSAKLARESEISGIDPNMPTGRIIDPMDELLRRRSGGLYG